MACHDLGIITSPRFPDPDLVAPTPSADDRDIAREAKSRTALRFLSRRPREEGRSDFIVLPQRFVEQSRYVRLDGFVVQRFPCQDPCGVEPEERQRLTTDVYCEVASFSEVADVVSPQALKDAGPHTP